MGSSAIPARTSWRQQSIVRCIALGLIAGILFTFRLWWKPSVFPSLPLIDIQFEYANLLTAILLLALAGAVIFSRQMLIAVAVLTLLCLMVIDQMKWQPWVYLYLIMLLPVAAFSKHREMSFAYWQLVIGGVYLWSGIHKMNNNFVDGVFFEGVSRVFDIHLNPDKKLFVFVGYSLGFLEALAGLSLLFDKTRRWALYFVLIMHTAIIGYVVFFDRLENHRALVPWNAAMFMFNLLLFGGQAPGFTITVREMVGNVRNNVVACAMLCVALILVWITPAFNLSGHMDHYLSFSLFSNKPSLFYVAVRDDQFEKIPSEIQRHSIAIAGMSGGKIIDIDSWAREELGVPFYPETRTFQGVSSFFCSLGIAKDGLVFLEMAAGNTNRITRFTCDTSPEVVGP